MSAGMPANFVALPSSQGAGKFIELASGWWFHRPLTAVANASGMDAACSKVMLSGILNHRVVRLFSETSETCPNLCDGLCRDCAVFRECHVFRKSTLSETD